MIAPAATTTTLTSSSSSPVYGQAITFVATVSSSNRNTERYGHVFRRRQSAGHGRAQRCRPAALTVTSLAPGSHAITATYNGAASLLGASSSATTETVRPAATAIVLVPHLVLKEEADGNRADRAHRAGGPSAPVPTGQVTFQLVKKHGKKTQVKTLGTAAASGGAATLMFQPNAVLNQTLTIVYSGDPHFLASRISLPRLTRSGIASSAT